MQRRATREGAPVPSALPGLAQRIHRLTHLRMLGLRAIGTSIDAAPAMILVWPLPGAAIARTVWRAGVQMRCGSPRTGRLSGIRWGGGVRSRAMAKAGVEEAEQGSGLRVVRLGLEQPRQSRVPRRCRGRFLLGQGSPGVRGPAENPAGADAAFTIVAYDRRSQRHHSTRPPVERRAVDRPRDQQRRRRRLGRGHVPRRRSPSPRWWGPGPWAATRRTPNRWTPTPSTPW